MDFSDNDKNPTSRVIGLTVIVALHAFVGYAVVTGLGKKMIDVIKKPVETKIIEEVKPPPPKDLPPPPPPPEMKAPPPPFIPPPEVVVNTPPPPTPIANTTSVQPTSKELPRAPDTAKPAEQPKPAPPAPPARVAAHINVAECEKPEYPRNSQRNGEEGTVRILFLVGVDNKVKETKIEKSSGHRALDRAAAEQLSQCNKFKAGLVDGKPVESWSPPIEYVWSLKD